MFDVEAAKALVADHFFKKLYRYGENEKLQTIITRWIQLLEEYSQLKGFIAFDPPLPLLKINPRAVGVLIVPYPNVKVTVWSLPITQFPIYPFCVQLQHTRMSCKEGLEMLHLYLSLVDIQIIGFFKVPNDTFLIPDLKKRYPNARIYGRRSLSTFLSVCRLAATQPAGQSHGLKSQPLVKHRSVDTFSKRVDPKPNPTRTGNE
ncbi:hypothetical protein AVEN_64848-1 [Araneus ventricosus]|uniref:Uncharacterized protein n=1 Tax=Araneus ventricosus TaxID=182803 RepID=A0A4Y2GL70_ARAVE|nr:hypothetical protein AVEN_64848-1 [Araneus ventricosus]